MARKTPIIHPKVLILEGLWGDLDDVIKAAGGDPVVESPWTFEFVEPELAAGAFDALILTGGSDVNPALYGEDPHRETYGIDNVRDSAEIAALTYAREHGIPVLGICRGSQIMCVYRGGKLVQHVGSDHRGTEHRVYAAPGCRTWKRACNSRDMDVISLHHQCVRRPGKGMRIASYAHDGTPEAIESKDGLWLGVQYHPEMNAWENSNSYAIFEWLVGTAARRAGGRAPKRPFRTARSFKPTYSRTLLPAKCESEPLCCTGACATDTCDCAAEVAPQRKVASRPSRQAGDPAIPSMRPNVVICAAVDAVTGRVTYSEGTRFDAEATAELESRLLVCPHCALEFDLIEDRDDHIRALHPALNCPYCELGFDNRAQLDDHVEVRHNGEYPFQPFIGAAQRYPELEPPPGHPAWDGEDVTDESYLLDRYGVH